MTTLDLREIEGDEARVAPFVAVLEGSTQLEAAAAGSAWDPQFAASGKTPASARPAWTAEEFTAAGKTKGKTPGMTWSAAFTASGKTFGKPVG